ncbi:hypothetical protein TREMEDRAFT_66172 [Tremella mesenterica DSM 1558]|uniref:uncharacterized protein n=1 Tax=Tremella mesenterica (strain ATCC 24925 / CBS 8224 / DSM 1558 / NBRC 9311 / NRRL Y-6157 / RJB 2259-6 / UBC 559-6) TaxID=578456 RepID=UPI00032CB8A2|nr:uncharacterized protein TREMEDRAFT_66172 [Tremella mesenterica DSM 1558]EIW65803.1 hypothetical protein TREMEDRAFT_66172 [Tremella mesenterica DSM 1558]
MITFRPFLRTFPSPQSTSSHFTSTLPPLRPLQIHPQIFTQPERTTFKRHITSSLSHYQSLPSDGQIPHRYIHLVQPDGTLSPLQPFTSIFNSYNHQTHTLQLVSHDPPIAKLLDKEEITRKALEAENRRQISNQLRESEKEVQIPWSAAEGDLKHKVELARDLLEKGHMVRLALAPRKKTAKDRLTDREKEGVVSGTRFIDVVVSEEEREN